MSLAKNVQNQNKIYINIMKIKENYSKEGWNDIPKLTGVNELGKDTRSPEFHVQCSSHWFALLLCKTSTHNTQCIIPLAIKWFSKQTGHYLSHILRFGAHVFLQHKKLIPYPATFNSLEM